MENLEWDGSSPHVGTNMTSSSWSLSDDIFSPMIQERQLQRISPAMDSINNVVVSRLNSCQQQNEIIMRPFLDTPWSNSCNNNDLILAAAAADNDDIGIVSAAVSVSAGSLESLDCFFSATNSNTDTSVEDDDGISMIFSDCKNLLNFGAVSAAAAAAVSSGESACNNELDETVSKLQPHSNLKSLKRSQESGFFNLFQSEYDVARARTNTEEGGGGFKLTSENQPKSKKPKWEKRPSSSNINFQSKSLSTSSVEEPDSEAIAQMKEMIYRAAAFRPVNLGNDVLEKPKRKNVKISSDPQTVAARQRRERISERLRVLQRLVPGGSKMDTASMLDEAANYLKFLKSQVKALETLGGGGGGGHHHKLDDLLNYCPTTTTNHSFPMQIHFPLARP